MKQIFETTTSFAHANSALQSFAESKKKNATIKENAAYYPEIYYL